MDRAGSEDNSASLKPQFENARNAIHPFFEIYHRPEDEGNSAFLDRLETRQPICFLRYSSSLYARGFRKGFISQVRNNADTSTSKNMNTRWMIVDTFWAHQYQAKIPAFMSCAVPLNCPSQVLHSPKPKTTNNEIKALSCFITHLIKMLKGLGCLLALMALGIKSQGTRQQLTS
jgi:hypothetical protein